MEQWSVLSNMLNCIQYDRHPKNFHNLDISAVNICKTHSETGEEKDRIEVHFGPTPHILKEEYLDVYEGVQLEIVNTRRFDENSDLSTTYLGESDRSKIDKLKAEESFPIHIRRTVRWERMSITVRYRNKEIIYIEIILYTL